MTNASRKVLIPPFDTSKIKNENGVKQLIKDLLDQYGWFHFPMAASGYSAVGLHDRFAIKNGSLLTIEAKFGKGKPTALQNAFAGHMMTNDAMTFCVNERNIDHLAWYLESFDIACIAQMKGEEAPADHMSRMLNAVSALTDMWVVV